MEAQGAAYPLHLGEVGGLLLGSWGGVGVGGGLRNWLHTLVVGLGKPW